MMRRGVVGSMVLALPVIVITLFVITVFILLVSTVLQLKAPDHSVTSRTLDLGFQQSRVLSDLFLQDRVILNEKTSSYPALEQYIPSDSLADFKLGNSFEVSSALKIVLSTWSRAGVLSNGIPRDEVVALFTPVEKVLADRYGCNGANVFKVLVPQPRAGSLGSGPGLFLVYDYPQRLWSRGGDGLPKLESVSSGSSILEVIETYRSQGYYANDLGSGYYSLVKGKVPC